MRVLILTCNTGEGHNSAARALKECFDANGIYCDIADSLAFLSPKASNFISKWHVLLYKNAPAIFGMGYKAAERTYNKNKRSKIYEAVCKGAKKLKKEVVEKDFDTVICTHPFSSMTLTRAIKKYRLSLDKTYFVATDYTCSPGVGTSELDYYIIPHEELCEDFISHKIPPEKLFAGGIPVSKKAHTSLNKEECMKTLSVPPGKRVILLMSGSMGCGPVKLIARKLSQKLSDNEFLVIICGRNRRLYQKLRVLDDPGSVRVLGFTRNVPLYMQIADLLLTKPGGLTTTEAAENHLPMILIDAVSGCETHNMNFWVNNGMAKTREDIEQLCDLVRELMDNPIKLDELKKTLKDNFSYSSSQRIYEFIINNSFKER